MRMGMGLQLSQILRGLAAAGSTLLNGLVSYWPLSESSGTRYDAVGDNDLTDNNTVGAVNRGPSGTVANFVRENSEYLSVSPAPAILSDDTQSISFWFKFNQTDLGAATASKPLTIGPYPNWSMELRAGTVGDGNAGFTLYVGDGAGNYDSASWFVIAQDANWHHYVIRRSGASLKVYRDGTTDWTNGWGGPCEFTLANNYVSSASVPLQIGLGSEGEYSTMQSSSYGVWSSAIDTGIIASLFNSGNGKTYADLTAAEKVGLVSYWNLDEVGGTRVDSHGTNDLTDNNTVMSTLSGPSGTVANFVAANSESLQKSSADAMFDGAGDITLVAWLNAAVGSQTGYIFGHGSLSANTGFDCYVSGNNFQARMANGSTFVQSQYGATPNNWYMLIVQWRIASKKIRMTLKGSGYAPTDGVWIESGAMTGDAANTGNFFLGAGNATPETFLSGGMANVGVWASEVSDADIATLFNGGVGKRYADLTAAEKVGLVSYWNLDEVSGTRIDSHGSNDLTDNNTVGSVINAGDAMDGAAASFVAANSEGLSRSGLVPSTGSFTLSMWFNPTNTGAYRGLAASDNGGAARNWSVVSNNGNFSAWLFPNGAEFATAVGPTTGAWNHGLFWYDSVAGKGYLQLNAGAVAELAVTGGVLNAAAAAFELGNQQGAFWNGQLDEVAIWSRVLTEDERTELYNAGAGKFYPFE